MSKIDIFGSCVSRDAFEFSPNRRMHPGKYFARSSLASAFHPVTFPEKYNGLLQAISSPFQRRMVEWDLAKTAPTLLGDCNGEWILVDLIDERFDLVRVGDAVATASVEFRKLGIPAADFDEILRPGSEARWSLWTEGAREFVRVVGADRIVLNRALWATRRADGSTLPRADEIRLNNDLLVRMHSFLRELGVANEIEYKEEMMRADAGHKWGESPFHFRPEFYAATMARLAAITSDRLEPDGNLDNLMTKDEVENSHLLRPSAASIHYPSREFPPLNPVTLAADGEGIQLPLFGNMSIPVRDFDSIEWRYQFKTQHHAATQWLLSLYPAGRLLEAYRQRNDRAAFDAAQSIIMSFLDFIEAEDAWDYVCGIPSGDHATATRTSVFVRYIEACRGLPCPPEQLSRAIRWLRPHAVWIDDDSNHKPNNHGLMLDRSLLLVAALYGGDSEQGAMWGKKAVGRVLETCAGIFDRDGYANENSPGYHNFSTTVISALHEVAVSNGIGTPGVEQLVGVLDRARNALRYLIWQDGSIPPLGDSAVYPSRQESINLSKWFRDSHLVVVKNSDFYLSLICGRRADTHKQVDDSSITLRYRDENVLIDGGSYNYDSQDPIRRCLESTRGHSGVYPDVMDAVLPPHRAKGFPVKARLLDFRENSDLAEAICEYELVLPDGFRSSVSRVITVTWPDELTVTDRVANNRFVSARQTFLFGVGMRKEWCGRDYVLRTPGGLAVALHHLSESKHDWFCGENGEITRGWYSAAANRVEPVAGVDFRQMGEVLEFKTVITLGREKSGG